MQIWGVPNQEVKFADLKNQKKTKKKQKKTKKTKKTNPESKGFPKYTCKHCDLCFFTCESEVGEGGGRADNFSHCSRLLS